MKKRNGTPMAKDTQKEGSPNSLLKALQLKKEADEASKQAIEETLSNVRALLKDLETLGVQYTIIEGNAAPQLVKRSTGANKAPAKTKAASGVSVNYDGSKTCPICQQVGHDGRAHRSQNPKTKFSDTELADKGIFEPSRAEQIKNAVVAKLTS